MKNLQREFPSLEIEFNDLPVLGTKRKGNVSLSFFCVVGPEEGAKAGQPFSPTVHTAFPNKGIVVLIALVFLLY